MSITIYDRPCGTGKTSRLLNNFEGDQKYLVVVPYLTEVDRVLKGACVHFEQPSTNESNTKKEDLRELLIEGKNVVITHKLYSMVVLMVREGLLDDYHVIIDEVPDVIRDGSQVKPKSYEEFYLGGGYVTEDPKTGLITPTPLWDETYEKVDDTLSPRFYKEAKSGCLYRTEDTFFIWVMPSELLTHNLSITIYTYLAEGSMLVAYLDKLGIDYTIDKDQKLDREFRKNAKDQIKIVDIPGLSKVKFSASAQSNMTKKTKDSVALTLKKLRERHPDLKGVPGSDILVTSLQDNWLERPKRKQLNSKPKGFSVGTGLFKETHWIPNTTRGTNDYSHCSHMIYLWDQWPNESIRRWLGMPNTAKDDYGISEFVQWIYRSRVRKGEPVVLFVPSPRMIRLLEAWLNDFESDLASENTIAA